jgi:hypothetical protein
MLKKLLLGVALITFLASCNTKTAFNYNEDFVKKEKSLEPEISKTETSVSAYMATEQYDSIAVAGEHMETLIDKIVKDIKDKPAPDVKEGSSFKEAGIRYFDFMKSMYTVYKDFGHAGTPEGRQVQLERLQSLTSKKTEEIQHIQDAQKKFADANGFKIKASYE